MALRAALPTSRHAEMLFESLLSGLGEEAVLETAGEGRFAAVYRRDREQRDWIVPWPILRFSRGQRLGYVMGAEGPPSNAPPPGRGGAPSRLVGLTPGELQILDRGLELTLTYGEDGRISETSRGGPHDYLFELARAATGKAGNPVENLIDHVAALDPGRLGSGRIHRPEPSPASVEGSWHVALGAVREALFDGRVPAEARWVAVDGFAGSVLCPATSRAHAISDCRQGIARVRPLPPVPEPPPELSPETLAGFGSGSGPFTITAPGLDAPPGVDPAPANTPIALVQLCPLPEPAPPFGRWLRLVDDRGAAILAALRQDERGITVAGADALSRIDVASMDAQLDAAEREAAGWLDQLLERDWPAELPPLDTLILRYVLEEAEPGRVKTVVKGAQHSHGFSPRALRAEELAGAILRQRRTD